MPDAFPTVAEVLEQLRQHIAADPAEYDLVTADGLLDELNRAKAREQFEHQIRTVKEGSA